MKSEIRKWEIEHRPIQAGIVALALMVVCSTGAVADDWLMYRKDAGRTAASNEKINLPLKKRWSWTSLRVGGFSILSTAVLQGESLFFVSGPRKGGARNSKLPENRMLVRADAKTGDARWMRPLAANRLNPYIAEDIGPAISTNGTVFVVDQVTVMRPCPQRDSAVRAYSSKGDFLGAVSVPSKNDLARFFVREGHADETNFLLPPAGKPVT